MHLIVMPKEIRFPTATELGTILSIAEENTTDFEKIEMLDSFLPYDMRAGEWILYGAHMYTIFKRIITPTFRLSHPPYGSIPYQEAHYDVMYLVKRIQNESD
jgi:hypothetical protein